MSPTLGLPCKGEAGLGRTALSAREVERAGVLRRVKEGKLKLVSAAQLLGISTRQAKRLFQWAAIFASVLAALEMAASETSGPAREVAR